MLIALERNGDIKSIKVGWSWTMFFFSTAFGIIWFMRGLKEIGFVILGLNLLALILNSLGEGAMPFWMCLQIGLAIFGIWAALKANELTVRTLLGRGYRLMHPESPSVTFAKAKWGLEV